MSKPHWICVNDYLSPAPLARYMGAPADSSSFSMTFEETKLTGAFVIDVDPKTDDRGFFARTWCRKEFAARGLNTNIVQCSLSFNRRRGTLRGMHYQTVPHGETKLVRCSRGAIYDVVLDLRPQSPSFKDWVGIVLTAENRKTMYVPEGCAHGFLTLQDETEVLYQMSEFQDLELARGVRFDDRAFQINWP
jgi:dTDP-4-dehydrorhamnose 3,5-epimerase